jgi:hypothetical protein
MKWMLSVALVVALVTGVVVVTRYPLHVCGALAAIVMIGAISYLLNDRKNKKRGWRVGHSGRDDMYYDEWRDETWKRIPIGGDMLTGEAHHVICFDSIEFPEWAFEHRELILQRVKQEFQPPDYRYHGVVGDSGGEVQVTV